MAGAQHLLGIGECRLELGDRVVHPAGLLVGGGEVGAEGGGVRVTGTVILYVVGKGLLKQGHRFVQSPGLAVGFDGFHKIGPGVWLPALCLTEYHDQRSPSWPGQTRSLAPG